MIGNPWQTLRRTLSIYNWFALSTKRIPQEVSVITEELFFQQLVKYLSSSRMFVGWRKLDCSRALFAVLTFHART